MGRVVRVVPAESSQEAIVVGIGGVGRAERALSESWVGAGSSELRHVGVAIVVAVDVDVRVVIGDAARTVRVSGLGRCGGTRRVCPGRMQAELLVW